MKINEYNQMMSYLTRPAETSTRNTMMAGGPTIKFMIDFIIRNAPKVSKVGSKISREFLEKMSEVNPENIKNVYRDVEAKLALGGKFKDDVKKGEAPKTDVEKVRAQKKAFDETEKELAKEGQIPVKDQTDPNTLNTEQLIEFRKTNRAGKGQFTNAEAIIARLENTLKDIKPDDETYEYVTTTFPNFIKELKANPKLAENENVWNSLMSELPSDQRFIKYDDGTVDFQTKKTTHNFKLREDLDTDRKGPNVPDDDPNMFDDMFDRMQKQMEDYIPGEEPLTKKKRTLNAEGGVIGGGIIEGEDLGSRTGFTKPRILDSKKVIEMYNQNLSMEDMAEELKTHRDTLRKKIENLIEEGKLKERNKRKVGKLTTKSENRKNKIKEFLKKEITEFEKNKILPNEKYIVNIDNLMKEIGIKNIRPERDLKDLQKELNFEIPTRGSGSVSTLTKEQQDKFKKEYKTKTATQIASEITGKPSKNKEHSTILQRLKNLKNNLIKKGFINEDDVFKGKRKPFGYKKGPGQQFRAYEAQQQRLANLNPEEFLQEKYIATEGRLKGKFAPHKLDRELSNLLNMQTLKGSLDKRFPKYLQPSLEHVEGITVGDVIDDPSALKKVDVMTRRYNFKDMGASSPLYQQIKTYVRTAAEELKNNNPKGAKEALNVVNSVYDTVNKRFPSIERKELPFYKLSSNKIIESNLKNGIVKPRTVEKSFIQYFKKVKDSATPAELEKIKKVQPNVFKAIDLLGKGKVEEVKKLVKSRIPAVQQGQLFSGFDPTMVQDILRDVAKSPLGKAKIGADITAPIVGTYVGYSPKEIALDSVTAGFGSLINDQVDRYEYAKEKGFGDQYLKAREKLTLASNFPNMNVAKSAFALTDDENYAFNTLGGEFDQNTELERVQRAEEYAKIREETPALNIPGTGILGLVARSVAPAVIKAARDATPTETNFYGLPLETMAGTPRTEFSTGGKPKDKREIKGIETKLPIDPNMPQDPSRRNFLEKMGIGSLGIGALMTGAVKLAPEAAKVAKEAATNVTTQMTEVPNIIKELYATIKNLGQVTDYSKKGVIKTELGPYELNEYPGGYNITKKTDSDYRYQEESFEVQTDPEYGVIDYEELTVRPDRDGKLKDVDYGVELDTYREIGEDLAKIKKDDNLIKIADEDIAKQIEKEKAYKEALNDIKPVGEND